MHRAGSTGETRSRPHGAGVRRGRIDKAELIIATAIGIITTYPKIAGGMWNGRYRGQRQDGSRCAYRRRRGHQRRDRHPEFDAWEWVAAERLRN